MTPDGGAGTVSTDAVRGVRGRPSADNTCDGGRRHLEDAVLGTAVEDDGEVVSYAVAIYERDGMCWSVTPSDLEATGRHDRRESFYDGTSIRVSRDGELLDPPAD